MTVPHVPLPFLKSMAVPKELPAAYQFTEKNMANNDVFISYRRKDLEFVIRLHKELTDRGLTAWFDQENIEVADHWRTSIAEGIRDCKVFILVLSPDAVESRNIRKEVDLAEDHGKKIIPLMWKKTEVPSTFEYALAGVQWIDFNEIASKENFDELADITKRLIGGSSMAEAISDKQIAQEAIIPTGQDEEAEPDTGQSRRRAIKKRTNAIMLGRLVTSKLVNSSFDFDEEFQNFASDELKWLFSAINNFQNISQGKIDRSVSIDTPIPDDAKSVDGANNQLLNSVDEFDMQLWEGQIESGLKRINIHLKNLKILLEQEAFKGQAGKQDVYLQNQIREGRIEIGKVLQELAELMKQAYGIFVTSPIELTEAFEEE
jgi:hypothetical protein